MPEINVEPTAQAIDNAARVALEFSRRLTQIATTMRETQDITRATEVVQEASNIMSALRLDLMVSRPLHEYQILERLRPEGKFNV